MASARKCDRCGKYYDKNQNGITSIKTYSGDFWENEYDLCDDCIEEFIKWMECDEKITQETWCITGETKVELLTDKP